MLISADDQESIGTRNCSQNPFILVGIDNQYCLTAKQYSQRFGFPVLADFEMRGMLGDIKKVAGIIADLYELDTEH